MSQNNLPKATITAPMNGGGNVGKMVVLTSNGMVPISNYLKRNLNNNKRQLVVIDNPSAKQLLKTSYKNVERRFTNIFGRYHHVNIKKEKNL